MLFKHIFGTNLMIGSQEGCYSMPQLLVRRLGSFSQVSTAQLTFNLNKLIAKDPFNPQIIREPRCLVL